MNRDSQMHFEGMDPTEETVFHARINDGDDMDEQAAPSVGGIDLQDECGDDAAMPPGEQAAFSTDDIDLLDDRGDGAATAPNAQAALSADDMDLQEDRGDDAVMPAGEQGNNDDGTSVVSVQEPPDDGSNLLFRENERVDWANDRRRLAMESQGWRYSISHHVFRVRAMTDKEFLALVEDIKKHGLRLPIIRWRGAIIDGFHRLLACLEAGVEPTFKDVPDDVDPEAYVKSANRFRRHLTKGEMIEDAVGSSDGSKRGRCWTSGAGDYSANLQNNPDGPLTQEKAAKQSGIKLRTLAYGAKVFSQDSSASPELRQAVREDKIAVSDASQVVNETPETQR